MSRLALDFATKQYGLKARHPLWGGALMGIGIIAICVTGYDYWQQEAMNKVLGAEYAGLQNHSKVSHTESPNSPLIKTEIELANKAFELSQTPWGKIFYELEKARSEYPESIALLSVKADTGKFELDISGEARDFTALSAFTSALNASPEFANITLNSDKLIVSNVPIVIAFDLRLNWIGRNVSADAEAH